MNFAYAARDALGHEYHDSIEAEDRDRALARLQRDGLTVVSLEEDDGGINLFPRAVTRAEVMFLTSQLAIMVDTGINLATALDGLLAQEDNPTLRRILTELKQDVEQGDEFSKALAKHPRQFDKTYVSLIRASEQTGSLGKMLEHLADYQRKDLENRGKVKSALAYPSIMLVMAVGVTIFLLTYIMPKFTPLFARRGMELPTITVVAMHASHSLTEYWYLWLLGLAAAAAGLYCGRRTSWGRMAIDWGRLHLPVLGPLCRKVCLSRSIRTLGTMVESGVPMLDALQFSAEVSNNYFYERAWSQVRDEVTNGRRVCESLTGNALFPKTLIQMIGSGEETGRLGYVLAKVSNYYDREVEAALKSATSMLEPLLISVMGVVVGGIGMSLMLPIFKLSRGH